MRERLLQNLAEVDKSLRRSYIAQIFICLIYLYLFHNAITVRDRLEVLDKNISEASCALEEYNQIGHFIKEIGETKYDLLSNYEKTIKRLSEIIKFQPRQQAQIQNQQSASLEFGPYLTEGEIKGVLTNYSADIRKALEVAKDYSKNDNNLDLSVIISLLRPLIQMSSQTQVAVNHFLRDDPHNIPVEFRGYQNSLISFDDLIKQDSDFYKYTCNINVFGSKMANRLAVLENIEKRIKSKDKTSKIKKSHIEEYKINLTEDREKLQNTNIAEIKMPLSGQPIDTNLAFRIGPFIILIFQFLICSYFRHRHDLIKKIKSTFEATDSVDKEMSANMHLLLWPWILNFPYFKSEKSLQEQQSGAIIIKSFMLFFQFLPVITMALIAIRPIYFGTTGSLETPEISLIDSLFIFISFILLMFTFFQVRYSRKLDCQISETLGWKKIEKIKRITIRDGPRLGWRWAMILIFPLLSLKIVPADVIRIELSYLCIPLAAYLGHRYGKNGIIATAIGGLLLPIGVNFGIYSFPNNLAIYLLALAVATLCAAEGKIDQIAQIFKSSRIFITLLVILPLSIWFYDREPIVIGFSLLPIFFFWIMLVGISDTKQSSIFLSLAVATIIGLVFNIANLSNVLQEWIRSTKVNILQDFWISYRLNIPVYFFTAIGYFWVGRHIKNLGKTDGTDFKNIPGSRVLLSFLLILWCGDLVYMLILYESGHNWLLFKFKLIGTFFALPLASFYAGMAYRFKGIALALAISFLPAFAFAIIAGLDLDDVRLSFDLHEPFYCFAYAALGLRVGDHFRGVQTIWYPKAWVAYVGLILLSLSLFIDFDNLTQLIFCISALIILIGLGVIFRWIRNSAIQTSSFRTARGWIALAGLVFMTLSFLGNIRDISGALEVTLDTMKDIMLFLVGEEDWGTIFMSMFIIIAPITLFYVSIILIALTEFLKGLPGVIDEALKIIKWLKISFFKKPLVLDSTERAKKILPSGQLTTNKYLKVAIYMITWLRNIVICITLIMAIVLILNS